MRTFSSTQENLRFLETSSFFTGFSFFFLDFYLQVLGVALGVSSLEIGAFTGAVFAAQVFSNPFAGYLTDKVGRSRTLAIGGFSRVISLVAVGVAIDQSSASLITIGRAFQGLAAGFFWTSSSTIVSDETEKGGRSDEFGRITLWVNRGMLLGAVGGLGLLFIRLDLPPFFFAIAAVASGIYGLKVKPVQPSLSRASLVRAPNGSPARNGRPGVGLAIIYFLNGLGLFVITSFLTVFVAETVFASNVSVSDRSVLVGLALAPQVVASSLVAPWVARIGDSKGHVKMLSLSLLAFLPVSYSLIWIRQLWQLAVLGLALNLTNIVFGSSLNAIVGDVYMSKRGSAYGRLNMVYSVGGAGGALLGGVLYPMGWQNLIFVSIAIQAMALSGVIFLGRREKPPPPLEWRA